MSQTSQTALLVMDYQKGIVDRFASGSPGLIASAQKAIAAARAAGVAVIYVVVRFRPDYPEISPNNKSFAAIKGGTFQLDESSPMTQVDESVAPQPGDVLVVKRRVGAFSGSDLDVVLRAQAITHLVLAGIATSGVVLSTLRLAADLDYKLTVLSDACGDQDEEVNRVLMEKVFVRQADVVTVDEWTATLG